MFGLMAGLYNSYLAPTKVHILLVGLDDAGKTALMERCKVTRFHDGRGRLRYNTTKQTNKNNIKNSSRGKKEGLSSDSNISVGCTKMKKSIHPKAGSSLCPSPPSYDPLVKVVIDDEILASNENNNNVNNIEDRIDEGETITKIPEVEGGGQPNYGLESNDLRDGAKMLPLTKITPTVGMNLAKFDACGCKCILWDLGGRAQMRPLWERYYSDCDAVIYVVDTSDPRKLDESRKTFGEIYNHEQLADVPFLLFFNKMDRKEMDLMQEQVTDLDEFIRLFGTEMSTQSQPDEKRGGLVMIHAGSSKTGVGVRVAFENITLAAKDQAQMKEKRSKVNSSSCP